MLCDYLFQHYDCEYVSILGATVFHLILSFLSLLPVLEWIWSDQRHHISQFRVTNSEISYLHDGVILRVVAFQPGWRFVVRRPTKSTT